MSEDALRAMEIPRAKPVLTPHTYGTLATITTGSESSLYDLARDATAGRVFKHTTVFVFSRTVIFACAETTYLQASIH